MGENYKSYEELEKEINLLREKNAELAEALEKKLERGSVQKIKELTQEIGVLENRLKRARSTGYPKGMSK